MNFTETLKSVDLVLSTNEVPLIVGESGIGKTALARKVAKNNNWSLVVIDGNLLKEGEIGGLPTVESYTSIDSSGNKIEKKMGLINPSSGFKQWIDFQLAPLLSLVPTPGSMVLQKKPNLF